MECSISHLSFRRLRCTTLAYWHTTNRAFVRLRFVVDRP